MNSWPRLSETLLQRGDYFHCNACGGEDDLSRWLEHDEADEPTRIAVLLCKQCSDKIIEPHPRLYRRLQPTEPHPGSMKFCKLCRFRDGLLCTNPAQKSLGGPGIPISFSKPQIMHVYMRPPKKSHWLAQHGFDHPKCKAFEVKA